MIYCKTGNLRFFLRKICEFKEELEDNKGVIKLRLYFDKPEVNRADLSCIFSLREN